jgi:histone H3/H4
MARLPKSGSVRHQLKNRRKRTPIDKHAPTRIARCGRHYGVPSFRKGAASICSDVIAAFSRVIAKRALIQATTQGRVTITWFDVSKALGSAHLIITREELKKQRAKASATSETKAGGT